MLRCWHLVWILVRTDHPCLGVGCHKRHWSHLAWSCEPHVGVNCRGLWLCLRVGVLTNVKNNDMQETWVFIQVQAFIRIKIIVPCLSVYYDLLGWGLLYPSFYRLKGVGFTRRIRSVIIISDRDSISTCLFYKINLMIIYKSPQLWAWLLRPSEPTHGGSPYFSFLSVGELVSMVLNLIM
jgi:hypothetical protein